MAESPRQRDRGIAFTCPPSEAQAGWVDTEEDSVGCRGRQYSNSYKRRDLVSCGSCPFCQAMGPEAGTRLCCPQSLLILDACRRERCPLPLVLTWPQVTGLPAIWCGIEKLFLVKLHFYGLPPFHFLPAPS